MRFIARGKVFEVTARPIIMGVLNVTPDSFYDGGKYKSLDAALKRAEEMLSEGADIIDVGGESTRPGSIPVSDNEEIGRVAKVIDNIVSKLGAAVSVDTYKPAVARAALQSGAILINDIFALRYKGISDGTRGEIILSDSDDTEMARVAASSGAGILLMHIKGTPSIMQRMPLQYGDVVSEIKSFLKTRVDFAIKAGVPSENIIIDPGIGFGKRVEDNLEIINRLAEFSELNLPILIGASRKSFIGAILPGGRNPDQRLSGTLAAHLAAYLNGARLFRVHDVKEHRDFFDTYLKISLSRSSAAASR